MSVRVDIEELERTSSFPYITVLLTGELCLRSKTPKYKGKKEIVFSFFPKEPNSETPKYKGKKEMVFSYFSKEPNSETPKYKGRK